MKKIKMPPDLLRLLEKYKIDTPPKDKEYTQDEINAYLKTVDKRIEEKQKGRLGAENPGDKMLFSNVSIKAIYGIVAAAILLSEQGLGNYAGKEAEEKERAKRFSTDLVLHLFVSTDLLSILFSEIAKTTDTSEKNQKIIAETLKLVSLLLVIQTVAKGNEDHMGRLFEEFDSHINGSLNILGGYLNDTVSDSKGTAEKLSLDIQKAKMALLKGETEKFISTCKDALALLNISPELLEKGLKEIGSMTRVLQNAMTAETENITSVTRAM